jgi:hypothetical protein
VAPDVLIVDEVLAVGDVAFQLRCLERMRDLQRSGTTIVFVSHHMHAIHLLCPRTVVLHRGRLDYDGPTDSAIARFHQLLAGADEAGDHPDSPVRILGRELVDEAGAPVDDVGQDQVVTYKMAVRFEAPVDGPGIIFRVISGDGTLAYSMQTALGDRWRSYAAGDEAQVRVDFRLRLGGGGTYHVNTDITDADSTVLLNDPNGPSFFVPPLLGVTGPADLEATIAVDGSLRTNHTWERIERRPTG